MNVKHKLIATTILAAIGSAAFAIEAEQPSTWMGASTKNRAEVAAEVQVALRDGTLPRHEYSFSVQVPTSTLTLTRAQVDAEAREAIRLGLVPVNEGQFRFPTAAENEQIRQAGQRAVSGDTRLATK